MKWYTYVVAAATVFSLTGLGIILFRQDPLQSTLFIKFLFLTALFISVWGIGTLFFLGLKNNFTSSFRRGLWLSVAVLGTVSLSRMGLLNLLNFSILLGVIAGIEWFLTKTFSHKDKESWT